MFVHKLILSNETDNKGLEVEFYIQLQANTKLLTFQIKRCIKFFLAFHKKNTAILQSLFTCLIS